MNKRIPRRCLLVSADIGNIIKVFLMYDMFIYTPHCTCLTNCNWCRCPVCILWATPEVCEISDVLCFWIANILNFTGTSSRNKERDEPLKSKFEKIGSVNISRSSLKQKVFNLRQQSCVVCAVQVCLQVDPDIALITDDLPLEGYMV